MAPVLPFSSSFSLSLTVLPSFFYSHQPACPNCRFQYALSKGGCMHFCCSQCRYQFCSGCNNPFHTVSFTRVSSIQPHLLKSCLLFYFLMIFFLLDKDLLLALILISTYLDGCMVGRCYNMLLFSHQTCAVEECSVSGLHAHHPRDCLFYLRDWEPSRLQALLQVHMQSHTNIETPNVRTFIKYPQLV